MQLFFGFIQFGLVALRYLIPSPAPAQNLERGPGDDADLADFLIQRLRPNNNHSLIKLRFISFCTHFPKVQQSEPSFFTRLKPMRMLRVLFVAEERF